MPSLLRLVAPTAGVMAAAALAPGQAVTVYSDQAAWAAAAGDFDTIDFLGYGFGTFMTDQYAALGVTFIDGVDAILPNGDFQDGTGLYGVNNEIAVSFDAPRHAVAVHTLAKARLVLYCDQYEWFYASSPSCCGSFIGLVSVQPFDRVVIRREDPDADPNIDDLLVSKGESPGPARCPDGPEPRVGADLRAAWLGPSIKAWGHAAQFTAYSFGVTMCNVGDAAEPVWPRTGQHPVIATNLYRLVGGRFEQIGMSWAFHVFTAAAGETCADCHDPQTLTILGPGCTVGFAPQSTGSQTGYYNGGVGGLGPRSEVNPATGTLVFPYTTQGMAGDVIDKRLQVHDDDLDPALNVDALYFGEAVLIGPGDAGTGNWGNNACFAPLAVNGFSEDGYVLTFEPAFPQMPALAAWQLEQPTVSLAAIDVPDDGRLIVAFDCTDGGGGTWHYEYALYNLSSQRAAGRFTVPVAPGTSISAIGFHDVDHHSGEAYDGTDWQVTLGDDHITWSAPPFEESPLANALRWGTLYNCRFDADRPPSATTATVGLFLPGTPKDVAVAVGAPILPRADVNGDGAVNVLDLVEVITLWGPCPAPPSACPADVDDDGAVGVTDLVAVVLDWS
jgi:hypothetical protein